MTERSPFHTIRTRSVVKRFDEVPPHRARGELIAPLHQFTPVADRGSG
ncbi:hypothetical protein [Streptomyces sp. NPDC049813]